MTNILKMINDAVAAQRNLKKIQADLKNQTVSFSTADGKIQVQADGDASLASIKIDPLLLSTTKAPEFENLLLKAINGALKEAKKKSAAHMQKLMAEMGLPNLPGL